MTNSESTLLLASSVRVVGSVSWLAFKAVASGSLSVVDYHEKKTGFKQATVKGVDDGISCTKGKGYSPLPPLPYGCLSVVDYHEKKTGFKQATAKGVDDGISCTKGMYTRPNL